MQTLIKLFVISAIMVACSQTEPPVTSLQKDHAIEVTYQTKHLNGVSVLLIRNENVYLKGQLVKSFIRTDTLPAPGDTTQLVEQNDTARSIRTPKEYEFFVTVK
jgi:hypothetical protein